MGSRDEDLISLDPRHLIADLDYVCARSSILSTFISFAGETSNLINIDVWTYFRRLASWLPLVVNE